MNLHLMRYNAFESLISDRFEYYVGHSTFLKIKSLLEIDGFELTTRVIEIITQSHSQFGQDLWILNHYGFRPYGFFVEIGSNGGVTLSNTFLLERNGWKGILIEPNPTINFFDRGAILIKCAAGAESTGLVRFEANVESMYSKLSNVVKTIPQHPRNYQEVMVPQFSLVDVLLECKASETIEYISLDIEGTEIEVLKGFDFQKYEVGARTIETNNSDAFREVKYFMELNGYKFVRLMNGIDSWFIRN